MKFESIYLFVLAILLRYDFLCSHASWFIYLFSTRIIDSLFLALKTEKAKMISGDHVAHLDPSNGDTSATVGKASSPSILFKDTSYV